jgi:hypothetical protein
VAVPQTSASAPLSRLGDGDDQNFIAEFAKAIGVEAIALRHTEILGEFRYSVHTEILGEFRYGVHAEKLGDIHYNRVSISGVSMQTSSAEANLSKARQAINRYDLGAFGLGLPLLMCWMWFSPLGGYPTNDDPFYGRPAQILADDAKFQLVTQAGELSASSVAHVLIGGGLASLAGFSYRVLFLAVILQLWLAAIAIYFFARESGCSRWFALFWASVLLANPLCFAHAFTFMTDAPAMSWGVWAIYFFRRGVFPGASNQSSALWLLLGSACIGVAFWMRQTHVLLCCFPVAVCSLLWYRGNLSTWRCFNGILASVVPAAIAVLLFESGWLVFGDGFFGEHGRLHVVAPKGLDWYQNAINFYGLGILLGFLTIPVLPILLDQLRNQTEATMQAAGGQTENSRWLRVIGIGLAMIWLLPLIATQGRAAVTSATGTVVANAHFGPIFLSDFEMPERWGDMGGVVWSHWIWAIITALAIVNLAALASCLFPHIWAWRNRASTVSESNALVFGLLITAIPIMAVILSVRTGVLDRYWMLILPIVFALVPQVVVRVRPSARMLASGLLVAQLGLSVVFARDFLVWNQVRWRQVETWLSEGLKPEEIDGGRDVNAWYRSAEDTATMPRPGDTTTWWSGRARVSLAIGPREGWTEIGRLRWSAWATSGEHEILMLRKVQH